MLSDIGENLFLSEYQIHNWRERAIRAEAMVSELQKLLYSMDVPDTELFEAQARVDQKTKETMRAQEEMELCLPLAPEDR